MKKSENFKFKKPSLLQAQVENFGDKKIKEFSKDQKKILKYSVELSKIRDLDDLPPDLPKELVDLIEKYGQEYINFLKQEQNREVEFKEKNAEYYKEVFQDKIKELKRKIAEEKDPKSLPEFLGSGSRGSAFKIEEGGKEYAAKFSNVIQANFELKPLLRAKGLENVAQLVAYSFEDNVVIMELLPGSDVTSFNFENKPQYSDEEIIQLIKTVKNLDQRGIMIDPKPSNFLYDKENGFSILDFHLRGSNSWYTFEKSIMDLKHVITGSYLNIEGPKEEKIEWSHNYFSALLKFLTILKNHFPEILEKWKENNKPKVENFMEDFASHDDVIVDSPEVSSKIEEIKKILF